MIEIKTGPNYLKIDSIYAYISEDENGNEGICGAMMPNGMFMPLVTCDSELVGLLKPYAKAINDHSKKKIKLIKLNQREDLEVIE